MKTLTGYSKKYAAASAVILISCLFITLANRGISDPAGTIKRAQKLSYKDFSVEYPDI